MFLGILSATILVVAATAWAANDPVTITFSLTMTGPNSAEGTFDSTGAITDSGLASQVFDVVPVGGVPRTVHGTKTLEGAAGTITIKFHARVTPTSETTSEATGRFVVPSGTGEYEGLHATGSTFAAIDFVTGTLTGEYAGNVH